MLAFIKQYNCMQKPITKIALILSVIFFLSFIVMTFQGSHNSAGLLLVLFFGSLALFFRGYEILKGYAFTIMIFAAVSAAMYYPQYFIQIGDFKLSKLIIPLMQIIMFGMGTTLSLKDFGRVMQMPKGVIVGIVAQYSIMPFTGWALTKIFTFPPEIAAGIILIGSCPSGLASNVMSYLARANVALSVTLTALATLMAPLNDSNAHAIAGGAIRCHRFLGYGCRHHKNNHCASRRRVSIQSLFTWKI